MDSKKEQQKQQWREEGATQTGEEPSVYHGTITVRLREKENTYIFTVSDDGIGAAGGRPHGLGLTLVDQLTRQIRGYTQFDCTSGYSVTISFPKAPKVEVSSEGGA